jgi:Asp-tRNA(Asn)/Glu-tRNA(Gln) amidotransferase A subunit family amidase
MTLEKVSGWEKASTIATCIQAVVVVVSLFLIWFQLRQQTKVTRAANTQASVALTSPLNLELAKNPELAKLWLEGAKGFEKGVEVKQDELRSTQYEALLAYLLIFHENLYAQHQQGLLDEAISDAWDKDLRDFIEYHHLERHWDEMRDAYQKDFREYVDRIIESQRATPAH